MKFQNVQQVRDAIAKYAVLKGLRVRMKKNDPDRIRAVCKEGCPWLLLASPHSIDNTFTVKIYDTHHKCERTSKTKFCNSKFLVNWFRERIISQPNIKLRDFKAIVKSELMINASLIVCNARKNVIKELKGSYEEEYGLLHDYCEAVVQSNLGSICFATSCSENPEGKAMFTRFYVCLEACKRGWKEGCRPIIGLDGCFLKGICKGQLLCAIGRDGNNHMFPIAWGVVQLENKVTWTWFLKCLQSDLQLENGEGYTIMSDMQKGLISAVENILPNAEHMMCARHIYANWAKRWRGEERKIAFWNCARATFGRDVKLKLDKLNELGEGIVQDVLSYEIQTWCKAYFKTNAKCDIVDNNLCETFNGWILEARCKSIITMLEEIRVQVMNRLWRKENEINSWFLDISPRSLKKLEKNKEKTFNWFMEWNGDNGYEITNIFNREDKNVVDTKKRSCTCREWDLTGIPCEHAVCAIYYKSDHPENFLDHWYSKGTYLKAYSYYIQCVPGKQHWVATGRERIAPPEFKKLPGRPKMNRRKDKGEVKKTGKISRHGRVMACQICKEPGHNIRTCPNRTADTQVKIRKKKKKKENADSNGSKSGVDQGKEAGNSNYGVPEDLVLAFPPAKKKRKANEKDKYTQEKGPNFPLLHDNFTPGPFHPGFMKANRPQSAANEVMSKRAKELFQGRQVTRTLLENIRSQQDLFGNHDIKILA